MCDPADTDQPDNPANDRGRKKRRLPKPATEDRLRKAALSHIDRYATSAHNLRMVLMRRVERSVRLHETNRDEAAAWVEAIVGDLLANQLLDDGAYARARASALHRAGASRRKITGALLQKGVSRTDIAAAIDSLDDEFGNRELMAACNYARRRRLGPYRPPDVRADRRERDLAALARSGFGYDTALQVIDAPTMEDLERLIED